MYLQKINDFEEERVRDEAREREEQENIKIKEFLDLCKNLSKEFEIPPLFIEVDEEIEFNKYQSPISTELDEDMSAIVSKFDDQNNKDILEQIRKRQELQQMRERLYFRTIINITKNEIGSGLQLNDFEENNEKQVKSKTKLEKRLKSAENQEIMVVQIPKEQNNNNMVVIKEDTLQDDKRGNNLDVLQKIPCTLR